MTAPDTTAPDLEVLTFFYRNYRGEVSERHVRARSAVFTFGVSKWHPEPQWFLSAIDVDKMDGRDFAVADILHFGPARPAEEALRGADGWRVRDLRWDGNYADTPLGVYSIGRIGGSWHVELQRTQSVAIFALIAKGAASDFDAALNEAKSAAQADYERRIMSAIERADGPRDAALEQAREALRPFAAAASAPNFQYVQDRQRLFLETNAEVVLTDGLRGEDFRRARAALAALDLPTPPATEPTR
ncbi:hypothetical protein GCM10011390_42060 [Aureimonas endophytica]|uniref:Uncharacterized protein n=1 Tax=Aureimonas endophytica TaxID=2027858 RepID=A0A916ZXV3_9HYPH|nr:hypothetical protein [Aureimonas endophytica]GGE18468.1 hypothetical protein GCM10011390_42060 [Aureimonas endophytica]